MAPIKTQPGKSRLVEALLETAGDMRRSGLLDAAAHQKITLRHAGTLASAMSEPIEADEIRALRERATMSQAVFARVLNLTSGYVSQLERGTKQASGSTLALLNVIRRKGIDTLL